MMNKRQIRRQYPDYGMGPPKPIKVGMLEEKADPGRLTDDGLTARVLDGLG